MICPVSPRGRGEQGLLDLLYADVPELREKKYEILIAGKNDEFRGKILQNISQTRGAEILAQEEILKPMRRADCDKITAHFFSILRRAYEEGHLIIQGRDDDDVYV